MLNIRDKSGLKGSNVIGVIPPSHYEEGAGLVGVNFTVMTEETEIVDDKDEPWVYVTWNGISGWVFAGYLSVERGGPKYFTPDALIVFYLSLQAGIS